MLLAIKQSIPGQQQCFVCFLIIYLYGIEYILKEKKNNETPQQTSTHTEKNEQLKNTLTLTLGNVCVDRKTVATGSKTN